MKRLVLICIICTICLSSAVYGHNYVIGPHFGGDGTIHDNGRTIESVHPIYISPRTYKQGFNDGLECLMLVALEMDMKKDRKTFGEMAVLCRKRIILHRNEKTD